MIQRPLDPAFQQAGSSSATRFTEVVSRFRGIRPANDPLSQLNLGRDLLRDEVHLPPPSSTFRG